MLLDFEVLSLFAYDISSPSKNTSQALKIKHVKFGRFIHELSYVLNFRIFRFPRFVSLYQAAYGGLLIRRESKLFYREVESRKAARQFFFGFYVLLRQWNISSARQCMQISKAFAILFV